MTQFFAPAELAAMTEQELRALKGQLLADLRRCGGSAFLYPGIYASLQNIDAALVALQALPFAANRPGGPKPPGL
jgi:hypothetical protein